MSQFFKSKASTLQKVAALPKFRHPADLLNMHVKDIKLQNMEISGQLDFNQGFYSSPAHQNLIKAIIPNRQKYLTQKIENRLSIATNQYNAWNQYLNTLVHELSEKQKINEARKQKVYESYLIAKQRNQQRLQLAKTVRLFYQLQNAYQFDLQIHPLVLMKMVHPHYGYLNNFENIRLPFNNFCSLLEEMIAVSHIVSLGHTLHADQLLSFVFWKICQNKPTMKLEEFGEFLKLFKFKVDDCSLEGMNLILGYHLRNRVGQIKEEELVRFDFWRNFYLERGL